jgi:hypothetical protein
MNRSSRRGHHHIGGFNIDQNAGRYSGQGARRGPKRWSGRPSSAGSRFRDDRDFQNTGEVYGRGDGDYPPDLEQRLGGRDDEYEREREYRDSFGPTGYRRDYGGWSSEHSRRNHEMIGWRDEVVGRGPKGYIRSDERIREDVCDRMCGLGIDAGNVEVSVNNGEVTLAGTVADRYAKFELEEIADGVLGVKEVHNALRIERPSFAARETSTTAPSMERKPGSHNPTGPH